MQTLNIAGCCWVKTLHLHGLRTWSTPEGPVGRVRVHPGHVPITTSSEEFLVLQPTKAMIDIEALLRDVVLKNAVQSLVLM